MIITGRFIPFGRVVVNLAAGAARLPRRTFVGLSVIAGASWAAYSWVIAALAVSFVEDNPLLAVVLSIVLAIGLGAVADRLVAATGRRAEPVPA
jgi:membrane protein DedA with SNARE-associated domain